MSKEAYPIFLEPASFPLSDATAILMRLELESERTGLDLKDRWREVASLYKDIVESSSTKFLFYDFHALLGCLYGNQR